MMKYPKPKLFKPTETDLLRTAKIVAENLTKKVQIRTPKGSVIQGKLKSK